MCVNSTFWPHYPPVRCAHPPLFSFIDTQNRALRDLPPPVSTYVYHCLPARITEVEKIREKFQLGKKPRANKVALDPDRVDKPSLMLSQLPLPLPKACGLA